MNARIHRVRRPLCPRLRLAGCHGRQRWWKEQPIWFRGPRGIMSGCDMTIGPTSRGQHVRGWMAACLGTHSFQDTRLALAGDAPHSLRYGFHRRVAVFFRP